MGGRADKVLRGGVIAVLGLLVGAGRVYAQSSYPATVTSVVDGDTIRTQLVADGREVTIRLIGIDTPKTRAPVECGGGEATDAMESLVLGQSVNLVSDPTQGALDRYGRSLFYVDRTDGLDVGLEMTWRGWSTAYVYDTEFERYPTYLDAEADTEARRAGAWLDCAGDCHRSARDERIERTDSAKKFVAFYYYRLSRDQYRRAWSMLSPRRDAQLRPFRRWKAGYRGSLRVRVAASVARLAGQRAIVRVRLRARDRDACMRRGVTQRFRGSVTLVPRGDLWAILKFSIRKTAGTTPRTSKSQCHKPPPPPPPPNNDDGDSRNCQGYNPCITPGPDVDCAGGSGNGPRYRSGPIYVSGYDPYDLDSDGNGVACQDGQARRGQQEQWARQLLRGRAPVAWAGRGEHSVPACLSEADRLGSAVH